MEAKAMEAMVIQKVVDTLNEEKPIANDKITRRKLNRVLKSLEKLQRFLEEEDGLDTSQKLKDYLCLLYEVEDEIGRYAFLAARKRVTFGFLMNKVLFIKKPNACRMLVRKINKILPLISDSSEDSSTPEEELYHKRRVQTMKSWSVVWPVQTMESSKKGRFTRSLSMIPQMKKVKKLAVTSSFNEHKMNEIGVTEVDSSYGYEQCYEDLSIDLKLCVLYLSLFPKDYDIPVRRLIRLWLAEGFVKRNSEKLIPEALVQKHLDDLMARGIIEITKLRSDNEPKNCRLVSVLHDYMSTKPEEFGLFHIHRKLEHFEDAAGPFGVRRMVHQTSNAKARVTGARTFNFNPSLLRSYLSFNRPHKDTQAREVGVLLDKIITSDFSLLSVLDLEGIHKPLLPENLGRLRLLKYLGLRRTYLDRLPKSVGELSNLETLDIKHTNINSLPDSISKLEHLRHLNLNYLIHLTTPPKSFWTLVTLGGLVLDDNDEISLNEGLSMFLNLRELDIRIKSSTRTQGALLDWIAKLGNLQSLRLRSINANGTHASNLALKSLVNLANLSHLNLYGNLEKLPALPEFPPTVKVLTLAISRLSEDPMETLERLPCLIVLRLLDSFTGRRMVCHRGGFKKLKVLKMWMLMGLEEWDVEEEAMKNLKQLDIRRCHKLKNISSRLLLKSRPLEEIIVKEMPNDFVARVENRKLTNTSLSL